MTTICDTVSWRQRHRRVALPWTSPDGRQLRLVAERLRHCLREADASARVGGDAFAVRRPWSSATDANRKNGKVKALRRAGR